MTKEEAAIIIHKLKQDVLTGAVRKYEPFEGEVLLSAEFYDAINMAIDALKQEPCEDAVSRKAVYEILNDAYFLKLDDGAALQESVRQLPPVNPQKLTKVGHWIMHDRHRECSKCGVWLPKDMPRNSYCPNCGSYNGGGAKMESEGEE